MKTASTLNERLSNIAERKASPIMVAAKQHKIDMHIGMFLFDVLSQWVFDELCCDLDRDADSRSPAAKIASLKQIAKADCPLKTVMMSLIDRDVETLFEATIPLATRQAGQLRATQFQHQLQSRYPNSLPRFPGDFHRLLAQLDEHWYSFCEAADGTGIAEAKSDRLRRYIWKTFSVAEIALTK